MSVNLLTEHHLEFLSLKGGCRGSSESTHVKKPHCWKSHALAHIKVFIDTAYLSFQFLSSYQKALVHVCQKNYIAFPFQGWFSKNFAFKVPLDSYHLAHPINHENCWFFIIFQDQSTFSRAIVQNSEQMAHFSNSRSFPGPRSINSR